MMTGPSYQVPAEMRQIRNILQTVICALTFLLAAASAEAQNEVRCRGGKGAFVFGHVNQNTLSLSFVASSRAAGATGKDLEPGTCAWTDRVLNDGESRQIQFAVAASDGISIPKYLDDPTHYWTFLVTGTNKDHFESKGSSGLTNAEAVASQGRSQSDSSGGSQKASSSGSSSGSPGGIPNPLGGISNPLGGIPGPPVSAVPTPVGGVPNPSAAGIANASLGGLRIPSVPSGGSLAAKLKGKLRRLALDTTRVSQLNKLIRGDAKPGEQAVDTTGVPVITNVAAALAEQSVIFSFTTNPPNSAPLVELAQTLPVLAVDKRLGFQVGPGLVSHPADGDTTTGDYWVDMNQQLVPGKTYYYIISVWKDNNPSAPRGQFIGSFLMPAAEEAQPAAIPPP